MKKSLLFATSLAGCLLLAGCGPVLHETATQYSDGTPRTQYSFYFEDDGDERRSDVRHGPYKEWHENGQMKAEGTYVDGERSGKWVEYYETGHERKIGSYQVGRRVGEWTFFRENGDLSKKGGFKNGRRVGEWTFYHANGEKSASGRFEDGRRTGLWTFWTPEGERHTRLTYGEDGVEREHFDVAKSDSRPANSDGKPPIGDFCEKSHIVAVVSAQADQYRYCYERSLQDDASLKGKVILQWKVGLTGEVVSASITSTTMNDARVEECMVAVAKKMRFDPPSAGICIINYPFVFSGLPHSAPADGRAEPSKDDPVTAALPNGKPDGSMSKDSIRRVIKSHRAALKACYTERLKSRKELAGRIKVRFAVGPDGSVKAATTTTSTLDDHAMETCVIDEILTWQFPEPDGGGYVVINYPFDFNTE